MDLTRSAHGALALSILALAACAQLGVPEVPPQLAEPPWNEDVYVAYDPHTVVGFGHTAVIVPAGPQRELWLRYEQVASAEMRYAQRLRQGTARFWDPVTARIPSVSGLTREVVLHEQALDPGALVRAHEHLLPVPGLDATAVRRAARARHARAANLDLPTAPRYWWAFNNSHHFTREVLRAGGPIHDHYFPKHFVQAYLHGPPRDSTGQPREQTSPAAALGVGAALAAILLRERRFGLERWVRIRAQAALLAGRGRSTSGSARACT